ncbi:cellulose biosynthesis cyclic di-GMP-binding regulatory protein BcsB [Paracoccus aestuariivivens]|uniref:Cyclic di-GMP-binding protein n=1 Tax=Paracoccus aestuariivivens TaxID=1820333 RepID=A0A6L6JB49_9RHOB|nr:cellulose biosynthesis cyclic di-GMP-binding regulatory protein BcsB [Paracoccus aestuariivivens]MTH79210.1 hypothetical protein [Paracoccus aestuariivivens]
MISRRNQLGLGGIALGLGLLASTALSQEAPVIQILPPETTQPEAAPEPEPVLGTTIDAAPAVRDSSENAAPAVAKTRMLALRPLTKLPETVRMGASLPASGVLRMTGEVANIDLGLQLPQDIAVPTELVLATRSAINVLPDTAVLQVSVNGGNPVDLELDHFDGFGMLRFATPDLVPGANRISLSLRQPHRIFCGPEASFGVWTEFDLAQSGVQIPTTALIPNAENFSLAVGNQISTGRPLRILTDTNTDIEVLRRVTDSLGAAMGGQGQINIQSFYSVAPKQSAAVALIASDRSQISYRQDASGAITMQIEYANGEAPDLTNAMPSVTLPAALPPLLQPGESHSLADLGVGDIIGNTRYYRNDVQFRLPNDWLLLANQKARLDLQYGFADDLPKGATLLVKVNDQTIRLLPLDRDGGKILEPLAVNFGARLLHPGSNTLSFEMMVPGNPADTACVPHPTDMLVVTKETTLEVPRSPAMQLRGISTPLSNLTSGGINVSPDAIEHRKLEIGAAQFAASLLPSENQDAGVTLTLVDFASVPKSSAHLPTRALQDALLPRAVSAGTSTAPQAPSYRLSTTTDAPATSAEPPTDQSISGWFLHQREKLERAAFLNSRDSFADWLAGRHGDAVLMPIDPTQPNALWLILGPEAQLDGINRALTDLRATRFGEGGAALLSNDGTWQIWSSVQLPKVDDLVTPLNMLPVLGNYASWSPFLFTVVLLTLGLISIVPALLIVILFRKRRLR